ncbi:MAG: RICIN domain-containing protein [Marinifilaceae bacterium]|jgi:hypothetical protein|nr:RICIN domain-containing protein [Marinifilaceae bacterium]
MKYIKYSIFLLFLIASTLSANSQGKEIISGEFSSKKRTQELITFTAKKGDKIRFNFEALHKRRGSDICITQYPGKSICLKMDKMRTENKIIVAPADAIYKITYGGARLKFNCQIHNETSSGNGPNKGEICYVRIPDTTHLQGYVNKKIGQEYSLNPRKEKVVLSSVKQSDQICNRDFFTGVDIVKLSIPGDRDDEYRKQKLLSYSISLIVQSPGVYNKMIGVMDAGIDAFVKMPEFGKNKKNSSKKMNHKNRYEQTKDLDKEKEKWENSMEVLDILKDASEESSPDSPQTEALSTTAFLLDTDGMKKMAVKKGMQAAGVPAGVISLVDKVEEIPSATDLIKNGVHEILPNVKGQAVLNVFEYSKENRSVPIISNSEFLIQSAMNYGQNDGAYWDVPGDPTQTHPGMNIGIWNLLNQNNVGDRRFKFVPSSRFPGYYEIHCCLAGNTVVLDNAGGDVVSEKNGNNIQLWSRHGGKCQVFRVKHIGGGKIRIYNYWGKILCLSGRSNHDGTNIHIWDDHAGNFTEWYLVNPTTKTAYIPTGTKNAEMNIRRCVLGKRSGIIAESIKVANENDPLNLKEKNKNIYLDIKKNLAESKAKLIVEAKYQITDYTDVIRYDKKTSNVSTNDFITAYKIKYHYDIMFRDQVKDYYQIITEDQFKNRSRLSEEVETDNPEQKSRLLRYKILSSQK